ncbi:hypothetical protein FQN50_004583 [Emmonsiellopsis sp. PD_5]|nr:hypothetical protein FQN50_004583 [Emmonsiellopsis sp. PD_5]
MATPSTPPRVLLLGGHGKIALLLTPLLLARGWHVTSVFRNPDHSADILKRAKNKPGKLEPLVSSLDDITSVDAAKALVDKARPDYVVWAAGAGGKGAPHRTYAIDRDAAKHFISATFLDPHIKKFLLLSHLGSRRLPAPWMPAAKWEQYDHINRDVIPDYYQAKLDADEYFTYMALRRTRMDEERGVGVGGGERFQGILLRPGLLADSPATGRVELGKTGLETGDGREVDDVSREDVAIVADLLLSRGDTRGWLDLLGGEEESEKAVERVVREGVNAVDGEDVERMCARFEK